MFFISLVHACSAIQSCPTLCDPMDCTPPASSVRRIFLSNNTEVGCHFLLQGIFLNPEIKIACPASPVLAGGIFTTWPPGKPPTHD